MGAAVLFTFQYEPQYGTLLRLGDAAEYEERSREPDPGIALPDASRKLLMDARYLLALLKIM
ncbi:MAG: hypothetical protein IKZ97_04545 [Butyrivibrio sp.]|nr:hypothetical protein [Butyrivibrio sp.]